MKLILIISVILITIILTVFTYFLYRLWNRCAKLKKVIIEIQKELTNVTQTNSQSKSGQTIQRATKYMLDEKEINTIADIVVPRVLECVKLELKEPINEVVIKNNIEIANQDVKFFRSKHGKTFQELVNNETDGVFKVFEIKGNDAKFEYCGGVVNSDFFTDICSFENNPADIPNKTKIKTTTPGSVKKDNNGNWEVSTLAKIKFE